jgi:hypothetical protein
VDGLSNLVNTAKGGSNEEQASEKIKSYRKLLLVQNRLGLNAVHTLMHDLVAKPDVNLTGDELEKEVRDCDQFNQSTLEVLTQVVLGSESILELEALNTPNIEDQTPVHLAVDADNYRAMITILGIPTLLDPMAVKNLIITGSLANAGNNPDHLEYKSPESKL